MRNICLHCGEVFYDTKEKKFCSKNCYNTHWTRQKRAAERGELVGECLVNEGVECYDHKCRTCGWNPKVQRKRLEKIVGRPEG